MGFEENSPPLARQPLQVRFLWYIQTEESYFPHISENSLLSLARETPGDSGVQDLSLVQDHLNFPRHWLLRSQCPSFHRKDLSRLWAQLTVSSCHIRYSVMCSIFSNVSPAAIRLFYGWQKISLDLWAWLRLKVWRPDLVIFFQTGAPRGVLPTSQSLWSPAATVTCVVPQGTCFCRHFIIINHVIGGLITVLLHVRSYQFPIFHWQGAQVQIHYQTRVQAAVNKPSSGRVGVMGRGCYRDTKF